MAPGRTWGHPRGLCTPVLPAQSQHLQGVSPTVVVSPQPITGPGLRHIGRADGQEGYFSRSVKPEGACRALGRIAQVLWPPGSQTQGEGQGQAGPQRAPSTSGTCKGLGGDTHRGLLSHRWHSLGAWTDHGTSPGSAVGLQRRETWERGCSTWSMPEWHPIGSPGWGRAVGGPSRAWARDS